MSHTNSNIVKRNPIAKAMQDTLVYRGRVEVKKHRKERQVSRDAKRFYGE